MKQFVIFFFFANFVFAQTKIKIIDSDSQKGIPSATVYFNKNTSYKNAESDGSIEISQDENISEIQVFGYENLKVSQFQNVYALKPVYKNIDEIAILKSRNTTQIEVGRIKKERFYTAFNSGGSKFSVLNLYNYDQGYPEITFIKKIRFLSDVSKKKSATINVVFYKNINGKPSGEPWESFTVSCKKGKNITEVNLENKNIIFPKEGVFIGFDWILNSENTFEKQENGRDESGKIFSKIITNINPLILTQKNPTKQIFIKPKLSDVDFFDFKFLNSESRSLSMELELSN